MPDYIRDPHTDWGDSEGLLELQARINETAVEIAAATEHFGTWRAVGHIDGSFAVRQNPAYDDSWLLPPLKFMLGVGPDEIPDVMWRDPSPITFELRNVALETMETMLGTGLIPLCERQIPAEGTE